MIKNLLIGVLALVLVATLGYVLWERRNVSEIENTEEELSTPTLVTRTMREETSTYLIEVEYPAFSGVDDARVKKANTALETEVRKEVDAFKKEAAGGGAPLEGIKSTLQVEYVPSLVRPELVSVIFHHSQYMAGAAHPFDFTSGWTWRLDTSELVTLEELFKSGTQYLSVLSQKSRAELRAMAENQGLIPEQINAGTEPTRENFKYFVLTQGELVIFFSPYQVASYAAGIPEVRIPYEELGDVIDSRGAIGILVSE